MKSKPVMPFIRNSIRALSILTLVSAFLQWSALRTAAAYQFDLVGPAGSGQFGFFVTALPNGNLVVIDPFFDSATNTNVGAAYLYDGLTGEIISTLTGSFDNDRVGITGVKVLTNGNYIILSPAWNSMGGAATWGSQSTGVSGTVSSANSLVGSTANDQVGVMVYALTNGNYVVCSPVWDAPGSVVDAGAVTWGDGSTGTKGQVSSSNSLVGSTASDLVGMGITQLLVNGNYVVRSQQWDGVAANAGAVTWVNGSTGLPVGAVSSSNSLVGSTADDNVGVSVVALTNGNYVVGSPSWSNVGPILNVGAATWVDGLTGLPKGAVSTSNSLVGSTANDQVGLILMALTNGNYVVRSPVWDGPAIDVGAATWCDGISGTTGTVSTSNSLHGSTAGDSVGYQGVALTNGNYAVLSSLWDGGAADTGAATWVNGLTGLPKGAVSSANSLVGSSANDRVGVTATALANGNYVVLSQFWNGIAANTGAATWVDGTSGSPKGAVSSTNSLVGSTASDQVGVVVTALTNGNYVVRSPLWDDLAVDVGAATWVKGSTGKPKGAVSSSNSLVGSTAGDMVGTSGVPLTNGNYVVGSPQWDGTAADVGAITWVKGTSGITGPVSSSNSLVGSNAGDRVGYVPLPMTIGDYLVWSPLYANSGIADSGAVTWGTAGNTGPLTGDNSVFGNVLNQGISLKFFYNSRYVYLAVGKPAENKVTLFWLSRIFLPVIKK